MRIVGNKAAAHLTFKLSSLTLWTSPTLTEVLQAEIIVHRSTTLQLASATWCQPVVAAAEMFHRLQCPRLVVISSISVIGCAFVDSHTPRRSPSSTVEHRRERTCGPDRLPKRWDWTGDACASATSAVIWLAAIRIHVATPNFYWSGLLNLEGLLLLRE